MNVRNLLSTLLMFAAFATLVNTAVAAPPSYSGTYTVGSTRGTIKWTPTRGVRAGYYLGDFVMNGARHTGYIYYTNDASRRVLLGYNDVNGNPVVSMVLIPQPNGTLTGPMSFYDRNGNVTKTGSAVLK